VATPKTTQPVGVGVPEAQTPTGSPDQQEPW